MAVFVRLIMPTYTMFCIKKTSNQVCMYSTFANFLFQYQAWMHLLTAFKTCLDKCCCVFMDPTELCFKVYEPTKKRK